MRRKVSLPMIISMETIFKKQKTISVSILVGASPYDLKLEASPDNNGVVGVYPYKGGAEP